jgi:bifunctional UDP-N-acetylglucosamine pyrophosphorylase/glucosamine-1-phosphate N-acetyltransferase
VHLKNTELEDGVKVLDYSVLEETKVEQEAQVGPFTRIRPGTVIEEKAKVGNFVEMKKTRFGKGSKASHLSYVGDAIVGEDVNIGAGTITCNYDGFSKHQSIIEKGAFIGSDTQLVAPVTVGEHALVGAGSTITKNIPPNSLALTRAPQRVREGKGMIFQAKRRGKK